jgi:LysR family hydrogen peroxide-inducible transcriptional activator
MKLNGLDLNRLNVFRMVIEQKGYRGASEKVGLTRSAISQSITSLEAQLGKKLFHRSGVLLVPTKEASQLYAELSSALQGVEGALNRFCGNPDALSGRVRIGAYEEFAKHQLIPVIETFQKRNPGAQLQFRFDSPSGLEGLLERDQIDLSLSIYPQRKKGIVSQKIYEEELCLVSSKKLGSSATKLSDISKMPIIDYFPNHVLFKRWWALHSKKPAPQLDIRVYASTASMVLELVSKGLGIGVIPRFLLPRVHESLQILSPTNRKLLDHVWLNQKRDATSRALVQRFRECLLMRPY